jgi:hypothetical protein
LKIKLPGFVPDSEFSEPFAQGMADRMAVSYAKYGPVAKAYPERVDAITSLKLRLERYEQDGNTEWLMDVGNFAMIEFMHPRHPKAHYRPTDSKESPGRQWNNGAVHAGSNDNREAASVYRRSGD